MMRVRATRGMRMTVRMPVRVAGAVVVPVMMLVIVQALQVLPALGQPRVLAEHQRLDGHRHGHRRQTDAAEVDVIEVP